MRIVAHHGGKAPLESNLKTSVNGSFGSGAYLGDFSTAKAYAANEDSLFTCTVDVANPLIIQACYELAEKCELETPALPLLVAMYGKNAPIGALLNGDCHLNDIVSNTLKSHGYDAVIAAYIPREDLYELVCFDTKQVQITPDAEIPGAYESLDFENELNVKSAASGQLTHNYLVSIKATVKRQKNKLVIAEFQSGASDEVELSVRLPGTYCFNKISTSPEYLQELIESLQKEHGHHGTVHFNESGFKEFNGSEADPILKVSVKDCLAEHQLLVDKAASMSKEGLEAFDPEYAPSPGMYL